MTRDCGQYRDDQRLRTVQEMTRDCGHGTGDDQRLRTRYRDDQRLQTQYRDDQRLQTVQG
ncbi:unnamed protein product [Staurois parvus]|uniref:Uncharacterized protein n=1 Tax=Staurois parvus TaxID=386267 RepID=A0ABN9FFY5_9NEOB|nr:unnamed protein product [Staurois parvus]